MVKIKHTCTNCGAKLCEVDYIVWEKELLSIHCLGDGKKHRHYIPFDKLTETDPEWEKAFQPETVRKVYKKE